MLSESSTLSKSQCHTYWCIFPKRNLLKFQWKPTLLRKFFPAKLLWQNSNHHLQYGPQKRDPEIVGIFRVVIPIKISELFRDHDQYKKWYIFMNNNYFWYLHVIYSNKNKAFDQRISLLIGTKCSNKFKVKNITFHSNSNK